MNIKEYLREKERQALRRLKHPTPQNIMNIFIDSGIVGSRENALIKAASSFMDRINKRLNRRPGDGPEQNQKI